MPESTTQNDSHAENKGCIEKDRPKHDRCAIVFFDGVCGLCNWSVDFLIVRDHKHRFLFSPLQGEAAKERLPEKHREDLDSISVWIDGTIYRKSSAVVRCLWRLGVFWQLAGWLLWLIPKPLRDFGYTRVSKSRYRFFGKHDVCRIPTAEERARFLD